MSTAGDIEGTVASLKARITAAQAAQAKAEMLAGVARDREAQAVAALHDEFGIPPEEVPARLQALEADLAAEAQRVREALERAEASE